MCKLCKSLTLISLSHDKPRSESHLVPVRWPCWQLISSFLGGHLCRVSRCTFWSNWPVCLHIRVSYRCNWTRMALRLNQTLGSTAFWVGMWNAVWQDNSAAVTCLKDTHSVRMCVSCGAIMEKVNLWCLKKRLWKKKCGFCARILLFKFVKINCRRCNGGTPLCLSEDCETLSRLCCSFPW